MTEAKKTLEQLEMRGDFIRRHIGATGEQITEILDYLELESLDAIIDKVVPENIISREPLDLPESKSERAVITYLRKMRERNHVFVP